MKESSFVSFESLNSGELVGASMVEITTIPDITILDSKYTSALEADMDYKKGMSSMLAEVYQSYRTTEMYTGVAPDLSLELLWVTEPIKNQPYNAQIRLFLIARAIGNERGEIQNSITQLIKICKSVFTLQKYEFVDIEYAEFSSLLSKVSKSKIKALVKEEKLENLQNQLLPQCLSFDRIPQSDCGLGKLVNSLIDYPHCAISMQLIPTKLSANEADSLGKVRQMLDTLTRGVMDQGVGNISFSLAEKHAENYKFYEDNKNNALFQFNLIIYGAGQAVDSLASSLYGQLNSSPEHQINMKFLPLYEEEADFNNNFYPLPWAIHEVLSGSERNPYIWGNPNSQFAPLYRMPFIITADEASEFFRLPIGGESIKAGLNVNESAKSSRTYTDNLINSGDITIGKLKSSANGDTLGISLKDLAKHMLVVGTPGSGKTTFSVGLLDRLWKEHHIPFLVIEPAKNEYRALVQSIPDLQVFTPGKNFISPFVFNPFVPPKNVKLETYKSTLKTAFAAAVSMSTPLDKIFEESINNCYSDFRWLDTYTVDDKGRTFNITDFVKCFQETFESIGYTGDAKNIGRAGVVRLNSLVNLFDNYHSIPIEDILTKPTIIELAAIENSDQKALIIALLLLSILAYVNSNYVGEGNLKNVILLEEAHVLLDADTNAGQGDANPSAIAQGLVKRMLAEIRSYGVGLIIADQSPRKVTTDVVALTDIKVAFRLVEASDKQILAESIDMEETQVSRLTKLKPGEAFFFFNKLETPEEIITPNYRLENNISITLSDEGIRSLSTYWKGREELLRPYPECAIVPYCAHACDYNRRILAKEIARRIFVRHFKADMKDFSVVKQVFGQISKLVVAELNDEPFDKQLLACVKAQLWRRIKYGTKIPITDQLIKSSLEKV